VSTKVAIALVLAAASTTLVNLAYLREHDAAAELPALSLRRPLHSIALLVGDRNWMLGFGMESVGFVLYAVALAFASLALVQSISAGGIGVLAFVSARMARRPLSRRELAGVLLSVLGLIALAVSLAGGRAEGGKGEIATILLWLGITAVVAVAVVLLRGRLFGPAVAFGIAGGLFFSIGDIATKVTTDGGARTGFVVLLLAGYALGTSCLQLGYQAGGALTVAGIATLLTNALPIAAGTVVLDEPVPSGVLGAVRLFAFAAVVVGAVLLARPQKQPAPQEATEPQPA
jgi:drug/metabolite transporter (DMT)-like permease